MFQGLKKKKGHVKFLCFHENIAFFLQKPWCWWEPPGFLKRKTGFSGEGKCFFKREKLWLFQKIKELLYQMGKNPCFEFNASKPSLPGLKQQKQQAVMVN